eukprot:EG_transcript_9044
MPAALAAFLASLLLAPVAPLAIHEQDAAHLRHEIDGFDLHHTYTYSPREPHRIVKHRTPAARAPKFRPLEENATEEPFHDQLAKVATFIKMNTNAYPVERQPPHWWLQSAFDPLYDTNETLFEDRPDSLAGEIRWRDQQYHAFAASVGLAWPTTALPIGGPEDREDIGVAVSVYRSRDRSATVLVFRGTFSYTNFEDIALWYGRDWIFYRWRDLILHDWRDVLGLPVTPEMLQRGSGLSEWFYNGLLWHVMRHMRRRLAGRISLMTDASPHDIDQQGYWPVLKRVVRDILPAGRARRDLGKVYLTGHSKGGALASQVSMWLAKEFGARYETFALEATGYQCWALKGLRADIDLSDPHPQIVTYRDVLSHYSRLDYQVGRVYTYGTDTRRPGLAWCSEIVGFPGAQLFLHPEVTLDAARCRYFHHDTHAMLYHLIRPGSPYRLSSKGVPRAHYVVEDIPGIPPGDDRCPLQPYGLDVGLVLWLVTFLWLPLLSCTVFCVWVRKAPPSRPASPLDYCP